ncbi:MAG: hypothetical protein MZV63_43065 [Marinilabiliales bacterium]|nr:hypothetical protein [Marinilabiliales bacterium]
MTSPCLVFRLTGSGWHFHRTQNGNADIYIMPFEGGTIRQMTFHDGNDYADSSVVGLADPLFHL